ncbi:MAG: hypothetical protein V1843_01195 [bacterium]
MKVGADVHLKNRSGDTSVFVAFKGYFLDSNSVCSAILDALLLNQSLASSQTVLFYYLGNHWMDLDELLNSQMRSPVVIPQMLWARNKGYVDDFVGLGKIQKVINDINARVR